MDKSTFFKFVRIGRDRRLPGIQERLPPSLTTIYEVSQFDDKSLDQALEANMIRPDARRADIATLRKQSSANKRDKGSTAGPKPTPSEVVAAGRRYHLLLAESTSNTGVEEIKKIFNRLQIKFGVEIVPVE
jgi:hypothetical protein